jgi:16S rRNA (cytosine967-C5)-methyltransferase
VLDACAAPGGKTVAMAAGMGGRGLLVAGDIRARRVELLAATVARSGASLVRLARFDAAALPFGPVFDRVLVDAPCSGLGTIRRDPEIRWRRTAADLARLADGQRRLIERAAGVVKPGGRVIYATCSSEPDENEQVVSWFLARHPEFAVEAPRGFEGEGHGLSGLVTPERYLVTRPDRHGLEGFFAAVLRHRGGLADPKAL